MRRSTAGVTEHPQSLLICDLTQSHASFGGGGVGTFLREKRDYVLARTPHRLLQIVPGAEDRIIEDGRHIWAEVGAAPVRGSPNYRFILRTGVVRDILRRYRPDIIESQCPWILPWTAINHRRRHPGTALVAGYHTDFPNGQIHRVAASLFGATVAAGLRRASFGYADITYRAFDRVYALSNGARDMLRARGLAHVDVLGLGVDTRCFSPIHRDPAWRRSLGLEGDGPLLIYAGRLDNEKRAGVLLEMFRLLPPQLGAAMVLIGHGKLREGIMAEAAGLPIAFPGYITDRAELARALASADIYVSGMADETFGISVIEAQASGLPVVGVAAGAMVERVPRHTGLLGPVDDAAVMARNVAKVWAGDAAGMGRAARDHVAGRFGWDRTFERLLGEIYPRAMARARERALEAAGPLGGGLARRFAGGRGSGTG